MRMVLHVVIAEARCRTVCVCTAVTTRVHLGCMPNVKDGPVDALRPTGPVWSAYVWRATTMPIVKIAPNARSRVRPSVFATQPRAHASVSTLETVIVDTYPCVRTVDCGQRQCTLSAADPVSRATTPAQ